MLQQVVSGLDGVVTTEVRAWYGYFLWIGAAALLGFTVAALFAGQLHQTRFVVVAIYLAVAGPFLYSFFRWAKIDPVELLRQNWIWGLLGALICGAFVVRNVLSQPVSARASGVGLAADLLWSGVVYGALDALLLSVLPVLATWEACSALGWTGGWYGRLASGALALLASLLVTAVYHLGYPEFRGQTVSMPVFGNGVMSLGYLLTQNPITALFSHMAMHIAAVLQGPATTFQLPPHY